MAGVRPLAGRAPLTLGAPSLSPPVSPVMTHPQKVRAPALARTAAAPARKPAPKPIDAATLDASWDRRLSRGLVSPDRSVDLHGLGLQGAYTLLDETLARAIATGDRVVLLVTGKPPPRESERPHARGAIRAAVGDWLAASRHGDRIAAVRGAHPRHGGNGAIYIILKRPR
ncbi:DNA mismatch repair protein MutS [Sphingomonas sp. Leaf33]|uniref:Smr/MutS family protein n=1 Tax=Sphingomonas sp. Leaf33 TaxID=1736215 RepID=UPI0006FE432E|nr:Smr/MutS family protein [Sphingomonas sp. Leaf33]KQN19518.1 DNA mismatch repair protein MutS [Sphingomonas sp. Leaf33]